MRIEVLVGHEDPVIFPLNSIKISVGSSEHCDIVINADGVSRKHLFITTEGDQYFVTDQGSANGSFINEQRLIPGRKTEFTSFFPVRLGDRVLLSLLSDEEVSEEELAEFDAAPVVNKKLPEFKIPTDDESTRVISINEMKKVRTEDLVLERNKKRQVRKKLARKKKRNGPSFLAILSIAIVVAAAAYEFHFKEPPTLEEPVAQVGQLVTESSAASDEVSSSLLVPENELVAKSDYSRLIDNLKCITDVEQHLCELFPLTHVLPFGVAQVGLTVHVMLNGESLFKEAQEWVTPPKVMTPETQKEYQELVYDTGIYLFLLNHQVDLDLELLKDKKLSFAFFEEDQPVRVLAIKPEVFNQQEQFVLKGNLPFIRSNGRSAFLLVKDFYRTY